MGNSNSTLNDYGIDLDLRWLNETVTEIKGHKFLYFIFRLVTFRLHRKLKYKELFLTYYGIHRKNIGEEKAKRKALDTVIKIYKENNGKYPCKFD